MIKIARNEYCLLFQKYKIKKRETHLKISEERLEELNNLKSKVQEFMLGKYENIEHIEEYETKMN